MSDKLRASSKASSALLLSINPPTANAGANVNPLDIIIPPATPSPPLAKVPPPNAAIVAFVAAAPDNELIAAPVPAVVMVDVITLPNATPASCPPAYVLISPSAQSVAPIA